MDGKMTKTIEQMDFPIQLTKFLPCREAGFCIDDDLSLIESDLKKCRVPYFIHTAMGRVDHHIAERRCIVADKRTLMAAGYDVSHWPRFKPRAWTVTHRKINT